MQKKLIIANKKSYTFFTDLAQVLSWPIIFLDPYERIAISISFCVLSLTDGVVLRICIYFMHTLMQRNLNLMHIKACAIRES